MCEICTNKRLTPVQINSYDPTHTTTLRNAMVRDSNRRFDELARVVRIAVDDEDCFGLKPQPSIFKGKMASYQMTTPGNRRFAFGTDERKVEEFLRWLDEQVRKGILTVDDIEQVGESMYPIWSNKYIRAAYERGIKRAEAELQRIGLAAAFIDDVAGGLFSKPMHIERVGLLYIRTFNDLKGITDQMAQIISKILVEGMMSGESTVRIARKLVAAINGKGIGELGLTDTLGRFIPARRRAEILARTEIIRAHHLATIQEYRNWGVANVKVKAEFLTAGDDRVCPQCGSLEGKIFDLDVAEGLIPVHPQCFIDHQVPIYTSKGWKPIGKIEVGDLVLTHKKRFRKVTALIRTPDQKPYVSKFTFESGKTLTITDNHPLLKQPANGERSQWKEAKEINVGDTLMFLGNKCKRCGKPIPYFKKYCSRSCISKDITDKQWSDPAHRKNISEKNKKSMLYQYRFGLRDKDTITRKANEKTRQSVKDGTYGWWMDEKFFEKTRKVTNLPKHRQASSERMKINNPMCDLTIRKKATTSLLHTLENHPEKRLNARMARLRKSGKMTWIEQRMAVLLDKIGIEYVSQYPILRYDVDFAIPSLKIVIECDGEYFHKDKKKDLIRQKRIENEGWFVLRYSGKKINQCLDEIQDELLRVVGNHTREYSTLGMKVKHVKQWQVKRARTLYNFSVDEDESYIAKGVVVHNCRCCAMPFVVNKTKI
jgi:SPP1 gp7 family putative phage head morphogenesis protein